MLSKVCSIQRWKVLRTWHVEGHGEQVHSWFGSHCRLLTFGRWMGDIIKARWVVRSFPSYSHLAREKLVPRVVRTGFRQLQACLILLCFVYCASEIFHVLQIKDLWQPSIISAMFLAAFVYFVSLSHILVIRYFKLFHDP